MTMFSNDMRVANTASPSFQSEANVGQFGWTGADQGHYNQLLQYVDECRKIWINLEERIDYVEVIIKDVEGVGAQVQYIELIASTMSQWRDEILAARDQVKNMFDQVQPLYLQFNIDYADFSGKYVDVVKMHSETEQAAIASAQSELAAAASAKLAADTAEELRKGQVYRGTWNLQANAAYPAAPDTNSVWDIVLNEGVLEYTFDGKRWFWGDRLLYLKDDNAFTQIESGSSVVSVNGKSGAVVLNAADVNAINKDTDTMKGALFFGDNNKYISLSGPTLYVAAKEGNVVIEGKSNPMARIGTTDYPIYHRGNKPSPDEIGAVTAAGFTLTGPLKVGNTPASVQNLMTTNMIRSGGAGSHATVIGNTSGRTYIDSPDDMLLLRANGVERRVYTTGYKPSLDDLGALGSKGVQVLAGTLQVNPGTSADPINLIQTFSPAGSNAQGISGFNSKDTTKRAWGIGAYANSANVEYAYIGVGESPWATGIRIKPAAIEAYQPLYVGGTIHTTVGTGGSMVQLNYNAGDGGNVRGYEGSTQDWYVGRANAAGDTALYSNKQASGVILRRGEVEFAGAPRVGGAGTVFYTKPLGTTDLNTLSGTINHGMYYQDVTSGATSARNYPIAEAGALIVMGSAHGAQQEFTSYNSNRKFIRGKINSSTWLSWKEIGGVKNHMSGFRFTDQTIASGGSVNIQPSLFASFSGIQMTDGVATVSTSGVYKLEFGFSLLPGPNPQNAVGGFVKNGANLYSDMIHNYCPASSFGSQMNISSSTVIVSLNAGDKLSFQVKAVNNTTVNLYQGGFIVIQQL